MYNIKRNLISVFIFLFFSVSAIFLYSCNKGNDSAIISPSSDYTDGVDLPTSCVSYSHPCGKTHCCMDFEGAVPPNGTIGTMTVTGENCDQTMFYCQYDFTFGTNTYAMGNWVPEGGTYTFSANVLYQGIHYIGSVTLFSNGSPYDKIYLYSIEDDNK